MEKNTIKWGIIGCGDVTEVKSGPAFKKVAHSSLLAVMRRNAEKAADYAQRHQVGKWYADADQLINDPEINAIYIATPPSSHEKLTIRALRAGKDVYVEKPMALSVAGCANMNAVADETGNKLVIAHYRRAMPYFEKVRTLINNGAIGKVNLINLQVIQGGNHTIIAQTTENWRTNPEISGGGLFHDLAPHQLDFMIYLFGDVKAAVGLATSKKKESGTDDLICGQLLFENNIMFNGIWSFNNLLPENIDTCEIIGTEGKINFNFFGGTSIKIDSIHEDRIIEIAHPQHVQQPMIERVVAYFLNKGPNPCGAEYGIEVLRIIDLFTAKGSK
ncbi:Gfo/Idh/MocA family protein [Pseudopedobacter beijingensis]|uniref:Gfo/Idh/MocA family protein n=1 Tax=Pseudopedobacter beijingensis TaxID=1207056 RepID=A0ABW4ID64_9SPHI